MPRLEGWGTFAIEHSFYGAALRLWPVLKGSEVGPRRAEEPLGVWNTYRSILRGKETEMEQQSAPGGMICEKCGASFETQEELDRHVQEAHPDEGVQEESQPQEPVTPA
jgi:hypothetical protein